MLYKESIIFSASFICPIWYNSPSWWLYLLFHFLCPTEPTLSFFMNHICVNLFYFSVVAEWLWCQQPVLQWQHSPAQRLWQRSGGHGAVAAEEWSWQQPQELPQRHPCHGGQEQESEWGDDRRIKYAQQHRLCLSRVCFSLFMVMSCCFKAVQIVSRKEWTRKDVTKLTVNDFLLECPNFQSLAVT